MGQSISTGLSSNAHDPPVLGTYTNLSPVISTQFKDLAQEFLSHDVEETILRVAQRGPSEPNVYPHDTTKTNYTYNYMDPSWWTSGFFPGSLWLLYERSLKREQSVPSDDLLALALEWQEGMESQRHNTGTHDLGFMMMPAFYSDFSLRGSEASRDIVLDSAHSLSSRWSETVGCLRSWDSMTTPRWDFSDKDENFLVIIDNMMNLDLLYRATEISGDPEFRRRATQHANTTLKYHIRPDDSTYHLVNYDPSNGNVQGRYTVQGYADNSTWSRGQAWALYGYATAYRFTNDPEFLDASERLANYFVQRVRESEGHSGLVRWDFDDPRPRVIRDESAAMVACAGILDLYELTGNQELLPAALEMMKYAVTAARSPCGSDTILRGATVNNNPDNANPNFETGVVYADYYFLEIGNKLLDLGLA